ncbi:hypothetical protein D6792_02905 [Candidatus Parcubacteria bacterium]|jgi:DnaK suppressor protein|nr:MAG: hypothetical protein D6792_02905 [Candidatus Parcubacteria bacterium]
MQQHPNLSPEDLRELRAMLEAELAEVEKQLAQFGARDPTNKADWEPSVGDIEIDASDKSEVADKFEELIDNNAILSELEVRRAKIERALRKMEESSYGFSEISGKPIERERLFADPAARTTIAEREEEEVLPL